MPGLQQQWSVLVFVPCSVLKSLPVNFHGSGCSPACCPQHPWEAAGQSGPRWAPSQCPKALYGHRPTLGNRSGLPWAALEVLQAPVLFPAFPLGALGRGSPLPEPWELR